MYTARQQVGYKDMSQVNAEVSPHTGEGDSSPQVDSRYCPLYPNHGEAFVLEKLLYTHESMLNLLQISWS